jgi:membrane protease YdiL (CAAX protease family)
MIIIRKEEGNLRWSTIRERLWLNKSRDPKTGQPRGVLWLWVVPFLVLIAFQEMFLGTSQDRIWVSIFPFFAEPAGFVLGSALESPEIQAQLVGAWGFLGLFFINAVFNTVLGEEFLFRGVLLHRMEGVFGK